MRIVLSGLFFPVAIVRYFQHALMRRDDVELFVVGPYTGKSIPWAGGMLVDCPLPKPDYILPVGMKADAGHLMTVLPWRPDLWLHVDAAYSFDGRPDCPYFIVGTDPHCINYDHARSVADKFFCMQTPYMHDGDIWLPYAYDSVYHSPLANALNYDFGIIGATGAQGPLYERRDNLVEALRAKGYSVLQSFGKAYEDYRNELSQCKIGINWSTQLDTTARVFETMGMSIALLTNRTPDLDNLGFVDGSDYVGFSDLFEAIQRAEDLIENDWFTVSLAGHKAVEEHTWDARVAQCLKLL